MTDARTDASAPQVEPSLLSAKLLMAMVDSGRSWQVDGAPFGMSGPLQVIAVNDASLIAADAADPLRADETQQARIVKNVVQAHRRVSDELAEVIGVEVVAALADWDAWLDSGGYERARQRRRKAMH